MSETTRSDPARAEFIREEMRQTGCLAIEAARRWRTCERCRREPAGTRDGEPVSYGPACAEIAGWRIDPTGIHGRWADAEAD